MKDDLIVWVSCTLIGSCILAMIFVFGIIYGEYGGRIKTMQEAVRHGYATMTLEKDGKVYYQWKESKPENN